MFNFNKVHRFYINGCVAVGSVIFVGNVYNGFRLCNKGDPTSPLISGFVLGILKGITFGSMSWLFPIYVGIRHVNRYDIARYKKFNNGDERFLYAHYQMYLIPCSKSMLDTAIRFPNQLSSQEEIFLINKGIIIPNK